jgi:alcohol dehydrogenase
MNAAVLTRVKQPLELKNLPDPEPGPGQVRIRIHASGLCGTDMHVWHGTFPIPLPAVIGHEPVGVVEKLGAGVTALRLGDRVGVCWHQSGCGRCKYCQENRGQFCLEGGRSWIQNGGANSELMLAEASGCTLLPAGLAFEAAAPLFCAGFTVMSGYRNSSPRTGDRVAVIGIGGLGHLALQIAKALGHETIAITSSESKRAEAKALGADEVLVIKEHAGNELKKLGGADVVLSTSNSMAQNTQVIAGLRPEGRFVSMAVGGEPIQVNPMQLLMGQIQLRGASQNERRDLVEVLDLAARGKVKPMLELYKLADINRAVVRLDEGKVRYRAVIQHAV